MKTNIIVNTNFYATHFWAECNIEEVNYLRYPHRHNFHVELKISVTHDDRDIEFIQLKGLVDKHILEIIPKIETEGWSCEMIARNLLKTFNAVYVKVMEDGENGAEISV